MEAIRNSLKNHSNGSHAGLILARYLTEQESNEKPKRQELFKKAKEAPNKSRELYEDAFNRWKTAWQFKPGTDKPYCGSLRTVYIDRMIVGFGANNVLEAGLTLHHTYGVPYIPGSAVKGLCSHYCHELSNEFGESYRCSDKNSPSGDVHKMLFGDQDQAGMIRFQDALIEPQSLDTCLIDDILTPHHSDYYGGDKAPTEYDEPVPVTFLSVKGKFLFVISCDDTDENGFVTPMGNRWINFTWKLLEGALKQKGIGGKTNIGYGYGTIHELQKEEVPIKVYESDEREILTRIRKEKGDLLFLIKSDQTTQCVVAKDDQRLAKKIPIGNDVEMCFVNQADANGTLRFKLTPELRKELTE